MITVGNISFDPNTVIGEGNTSTVYDGKFQNRDVAVKQIAKTQLQVVEREIDLLVKSDGHPNILRYFFVEQDNDYQYIALERCHFTLADYVERHDDIRKQLPPKMLIEKIFRALEWLHELQIGWYSFFFTKIRIDKIYLI